MHSNYQSYMFACSFFLLGAFFVPWHIYKALYHGAALRDMLSIIIWSVSMYLGHETISNYVHVTP